MGVYRKIVVSQLSVVAEYGVCHKPAQAVLKQYAKPRLCAIAVGGLYSYLCESSCTVERNWQAFTLEKRSGEHRRENISRTGVMHRDMSPVYAPEAAALPVKADI